MAGLNWEVDVLCRFLLCPFAIGQLVEFALDSNYLSLIFLICRNQTNHDVLVWDFAGSCAFFEFVPSFPPVYFIHNCSSSYIAFRLFSISVGLEGD